jgi:UDPglucose--hexose-1-phosphate uridylyltransferase
MPASTELRHDPVLDRLVIVAAGRAARPHTVAGIPQEGDGGAARCPFCPGHESDTPPELARTGEGAPGDPGWRVRVFPNLYPVVGGAGAGEGTTGAHEVVVLSPDHRRGFSALSDDGACEVVRTLRDRTHLHVEAGRPYAVAFVNHRRAAGASIAHPHAQVVALDFAPPEVRAAARRAEGGDDLLDRDLADARGAGTVLGDGGVAVWLPYASGSPYLVRIADPDTGPRFDDADDVVIDRVAVALRALLTRVDDALGDPPYNVTFHTAAADGTGVRRWYVEVTPRLSVVAGFEAATGVLVNTTPPEQAVGVLRGDSP